MGKVGVKRHIGGTLKFVAFLNSRRLNFMAFSNFAAFSIFFAKFATFLNSCQHLRSSDICRVFMFIVRGKIPGVKTQKNRNNWEILRKLRKGMKKLRKGMKTVNIIKSVHRVVFFARPSSSLPKEYFENVDF